MGLKEKKRKEKVNKKKNISANLISRQSPYQLVQTLKSLTDRQKVVLREIGFGCMVDFSIKSLPMSLALLLVDRLDAQKCEMMVGENLMKITKKDVHEILGFPMGNKEMKSLRKAGLVKNDLVKTWKLRFPMPKTGSQTIKLTDVKKKIEGEPEGGSDFKIDILLSIVTVMAESITCGTINQRVLGSINDENDIKDMDWCGYVIDCLKRSKDKWSKDSWYTGPLTFLVVWYAQHISKKQKGTPAILHWTSKELKSIEQMELSGAKFDEEMQNPKPSSIDYSDKVRYAGDGDEVPEYNNETNFDDRESTKDEKAFEVEFEYQTIKDPEERKQGDTDGRTTRSLMDKHAEQTTPATARQSTVATLIINSTKQTNLDKNSLPSKRQKDDIEVGFVDSSEKTNVPSIGQSEGFDSEASGMNDQAFGKTENLSHGKKVRSKRGKSIELETPTADSSRKGVRSANEVKILEAPGAEVDSVETRAQEIVDGAVNKDLTIPVVMGLQCNGMTVSQGKILQKLPNEEIPDVAKVDTKQPEGPLAPLTEVKKEGKEGDAASVTPKRKRGRPPKLQAIGYETQVAVNEQNGGDVGHSAVSVVEDAQRKVDGLPTSSGTKSSEENQEPVREQAVLGTEQNVRKRKKYSSIKGKRGRRRTISVNAEALAQGFQDTLKEKADDNLKKDSATINSDENLEKDSATRNSEASVGKSLDIMSDDQPLSRWFEGKHSPMTVHGTDGSVGQPSQVGERRLDIVTFDMDADSWPFVRTTPLWQTIESLEAFHKIPQKPHFRPLLEGVKPGAREGLAIGTMVTFSTVVDKTCGLRFEDPRSTIEDCLETLVELESYGFDVEVIRERLTGLLLVKDKQEELDERSKGVEVKIEEHMVQGNTKVEEIEEIDRQIRELEERRGQLLLEKENRNSKINDMKAAWEGIEEEMRKIGAEFDKLASAPL